MAYSKKLKLIRARVPGVMKDALRRIAADRGESESVILREAVAFYINALLHKPIARNPHIRQLLADLREQDDNE